MVIKTGGRATVRVRLEVEVTVGIWDSSASFESLAQQASREAERILSRKIEGARTGGTFRIVGAPKSMHVILVGDING